MDQLNNTDTDTDTDEWIDQIRKLSTNNAQMKDRKRTLQANKFICLLKQQLNDQTSSLRRRMLYSSVKGKKSIEIKEPFFIGSNRFRAAYSMKEYVCRTLKEEYQKLNFSFRVAVNNRYFLFISWS